MKRALLLLLLILSVCISLSFAAEFLYRDSRGHFHYLCSSKKGRRVEIIRRGEGILILSAGHALPLVNDDATVGHLLDKDDMEYFARAACKALKE